MAGAADGPVTIEGWLGYHGEGDTRHELIGGRLVARNPPKAWHASIANEIGVICGEALRNRFPWRALQGVGLQVRREPKAKGYIPDIVVTGEPVDVNRPLAEEPVLVVEVLSPSTDRYDRTAKLEDYMRLPTVREVWLVFSESRIVLQTVRAEDGWRRPEAFIGKASFESPVLRVTVALADIYRFTPLGGPAEHEEDQAPS